MGERKKNYIGHNSITILTSGNFLGLEDCFYIIFGKNDALKDISILNTKPIKAKYSALVTSPKLSVYMAPAKPLIAALLENTAL